MVTVFVGSDCQTYLTIGSLTVLSPNSFRKGPRSKCSAPLSTNWPDTATRVTPWHVVVVPAAERACTASRCSARAASSTC